MDTSYTYSEGGRKTLTKEKAVSKDRCCVILRNLVTLTVYG